MDIASGKGEMEYGPFMQYSDDPTTYEPETERELEPKPRRNGALPYLMVVLATSIFWILVLVATSSSFNASHFTSIDHPSNRTTNARRITCGNSTEKAKANDCKFDILMNMWVPAPCFDEEFLDEYMDDLSWSAFSDEAMTQRLNVSQMSEVEDYYTSVRDHVNHCGVMWKKQFWALFEDRSAVDSVITSPGHTDHCAEYLMDVAGIDVNSPTKVEKGYADCWIRS